jgi:hypothetical protein
MNKANQQQSPSCDTAAHAAGVFAPESVEAIAGHCVVTLLCSLKDEPARRRYLQLTREIALPRKAADPACLRATQTIPQNTDEVQVLWIEEWTGVAEFKAFMRHLFAENPRLHEVDQCLVSNPRVTISTAVRASDF